MSNWAASPREQKFFGSFFQKRTLPFLLRSNRLVIVFRWYLTAFAWLRFSALRLSRDGIPAPHTGRPLVIFSNHPSWWDPAIYLLIGARCFPGRAAFGPMAADELRRWGFFRRLGVFGVEPGWRGAASFLRISRQVLADPRAALWITAEGAFTDPRLRPLRLQPGIAHLARDLPGTVFIPLALDYVFWNESRPEALLRFGAPVTADGAGDVAHWTRVLTAALTATMDALAADSASRDPARFVTLLPGATQTGLLFQKSWRTEAA